jgi:hypothetical protein
MHKCSDKTMIELSLKLKFKDLTGKPKVSWEHLLSSWKLILGEIYFHHN